MSIANFEQLQDITQDLWRKAKAKIEAIAMIMLVKHKKI